jgi:hypothetical protein
MEYAAIIKLVDARSVAQGSCVPGRFAERETTALTMNRRASVSTY